MRMRRAAGTGVPDGDDLLGVYDGLAVRLDAPGLGGSNPRLEAIQKVYGIRSSRGTIWAAQIALNEE
jgi:hypothetical protein